jgi:hypothetical protein
MSAASKRAWRAANPERRRAHERARATNRRRHGSIIEFTPGKPAVFFTYPSGESYRRYEVSIKRDLKKTMAACRRRIANLKAQIAAMDAEWQESTRELNAYLAGR